MPLKPRAVLQKCKVLTEYCEIDGLSESKLASGNVPKSRPIENSTCRTLTLCSKTTQNTVQDAAKSRSEKVVIFSIGVS